MAIAHDADSNSGEVTTQVFSWSHTCTGTNLLLVVGVSIDGTGGAPQSVTGITYAGAALTFVRRDTRAVDGLATEIWYKIAPATGANTVQVTLSAAPAFGACAGAISLTGADQGAQPDSSNGANGASGTQPSVTVTTIADNCWIVDVVQANSNVAMTAGQTQAWQVAGPLAGARYGGEYFGPQTPAGAKAMTWTGLNNSWCTTAASFDPFIPGGGILPSVSDTEYLIVEGSE